MTIDWMETAMNMLSSLLLCLALLYPTIEVCVCVCVFLFFVLIKNRTSGYGISSVVLHTRRRTQKDIELYRMTILY